MLIAKAVVGTIIQNRIKLTIVNFKFINRVDRKNIVEHTLITRSAPNISTNFGANRIKILMGKIIARRRMEFVDWFICSPS